MKTEIIFLCQRVPYPPDRGDRITTWNFLQRLCQTYAVHLFCLASDLNDLEKKDVLSKHCASVHIYFKSLWQSRYDAGLGLFSREPISNSYYHSPAMRVDIQQLLQTNTISMIYAYSSNMFGHVEYQHTKVPKIYHYGDVDSEKWHKMAKCGQWWLRPIYRLEFKRLRAWELACAQSAYASVFATQQEADFFQTLGGQGKLVSIPNGVDSDYFQPDETVAKENAIVFTGVMNYFPNVDTVLCFYQEVYPLLKQEFPGIRFYIVGSNPTPEIQALGKADSQCIVTGYVKDVRPYLNCSKIFVAPMKVAQGMQNKILEALAMQVPVITYSKIAAPLGLTPEQGVIGVNSPEEMSHAIVHWLQHEPERQTLAQYGRQAILEHYRWETQLKKLDTLVSKAIGAAAK